MKYRILEGPAAAKYATISFVYANQAEKIELK